MIEGLQSELKACHHGCMPAVSVRSKKSGANACVSRPGGFENVIMVAEHVARVICR